MVQPPGQSYLRDIIIKREGGVESGEEAGRRQREEEGGREEGRTRGQEQPPSEAEC
jgi:hypothetical protein